MKTNHYKKTAFAITFCGLFLFFTRCQKKDTETVTKNQHTTTGFSTSKQTSNATEGAIVTCAGTGINHEISKDLAKKMIDKYRSAIRNRTIAGIVSTAGWNFTETFTGNDISRLLAQANCCNFRIYYGLGISDNKMHAIMVGTTPSGFDIFSFVPSSTAAEPPPPPIIIENSQLCPTMCPGVYVGP